MSRWGWAPSEYNWRRSNEEGDGEGDGGDDGGDGGDGGDGEGD